MADKIADIEVANVNEDAEEVKAIMKNKPVYKIGEKKNKISPVVPDATTTPPPQRECVEEQQSIDTILKAKQEDAANLRRKRTTIIQDRIRQSYIIQGKDPEAVSQEQIEEDAGNAFHSMWSGLGSLSKSGKVLVQGALEKVENVTSKVEGKMKEVHVYPSEVLERVTSGFPKKKYAALHGSLLPVADQLYHINKKIKEEGMKLDEFEGINPPGDQDQKDEITERAEKENEGDSQVKENSQPISGSDVPREEQTITIRADTNKSAVALGGTFTISYSGATTPDLGCNCPAEVIFEEVQALPTMKDDGLMSVEQTIDKTNEKAWRFKFDTEAGELPMLEVDDNKLSGTNATIKVTTNHDKANKEINTAKRKARATQKIKHSKNVLRALNLSGDEVDYFYGAFCEAGKDQNNENGAIKQISLDEFIKWLQINAGRGSKLHEIDKDYEFLVNMIKSIHYFDVKEAQRRFKKNEGKRRVKRGEITETQLAEEKVKANKVDDHPRDESEEDEKKSLQMKYFGYMIYMTFIDFVLVTWSFLSLSEDMMAMQAWEFLEIGYLERDFLECKVEEEHAIQLVRYFQPENKGNSNVDWSKKRTKEGLNKRAQKVLDLIKDSALVKREEDGKEVYLGNFFSICKVNRSFTFQVCRLQLDISTLLLGTNFWKRQKAWREKRFGLSNLHNVLNGSYTDPAVFRPMDTKTLEAEKRAEDWCAENLGDETDSIALQTATERQTEQLSKIELEEKQKLLEKEAKEQFIQAEIDSGTRRASCVAEEMEDQAQAVIKEFRRKKKVRQLGTAILRIDKKVANGERLSEEENWLFAKANAQAKAGNRLYARESKVVRGEVKKEWGLSRPNGAAGDDILEDDGEEEGEEEDDSIPVVQTIADKRRALALKNGGKQQSKFDYMGNIHEADRNISDIDDQQNKVRIRMLLREGQEK